MAWDAERIKTAVMALLKELGEDYDVRAHFTQDREEVLPTTVCKAGEFRNFKLREGSQRVTVNIRPKGSIVEMSEFMLTGKE